MPFCPNCGRSSEGQFCTDCGTSLTQYEAARPIQKRTKSSLFLILIIVIAMSAGLAVSPYIMAPRVQTTMELQTVTETTPTITTQALTVTSVTTYTASVTETKTNEITYNPTSNALLYSWSTSVYMMTTNYQTSQYRQSCDPSYPTVCIPSPPPDLDCRDISYRNFQVLPPDPHHFDGDHDGIGCET